MLSVYVCVLGVCMCVNARAYMYICVYWGFVSHLLMPSLGSCSDTGISVNFAVHIVPT